MAIKRNVLAESGATVQTEDGTTMYATIQMRHGKESDMDKSKFVPAEIGVATDTKKMVVAFAPNDTKEVAFKDDLDGLINKNQGTENSGKVLVVGKDGNVAPGETPIEIDSTLTQSGQAADAKATGDKISSLSEETSKVKNELKHINILNAEDGTSGYAYKYSIGSGIEKTENHNYTAFNQIFSVKESEKYTHNALYGALYVYDNSKKLILYDYADSIPHTLTIPENGIYMTVAGSTSRIDNIMVVLGETLPDEYIPYELLDIKTAQGNNLEKQINEFEKYSSLKGVKWCAFGDSLTSSATLQGMESGEKNYVDYVSESLGLDVTNCGVGGTGYMKTENNFVSRVQTIPMNTEILTVVGSFNDFEYIETSLGEMGDSGTTTIYGCMKSFYDAVFTRCPDIVVGIILPTKWGYLSSQKDPSASVKCDQYISALKDIAKYYSIPVLDLYNFSNLRPWNDIFASKFYKDDDLNGTANTVHPLDPAHKKFIAPKVEAFIKSIYKKY